jgi:hypothetical protein
MDGQLTQVLGKPALHCLAVTIDRNLRHLFLLVARRGLSPAARPT